MIREIDLRLAEADTDLVPIMAARVGADVLAQYQNLALSLRRKGWNEAAVAQTADPAIRAAHRYASELYETAASELDDLVANLLDSLERPPTAAVRTPILRVIDGGQAKTNLD